MDFNLFYEYFEALCANEGEMTKIIPEGRRLLQELLNNQAWYPEFLEKIIFDPEFRKLQKPSPWPNEMTLKRSDSGAFVVFSYTWEPHQTDVVHDHGSWGIIGILKGRLFEKTYRRLDDGSQEGYAELAEKSYAILAPKETTAVLPLDEGIHQMGNISDFSISINIYGKNIRKGYSRFFDPEKKTVWRAYIPSLQKAVLAIRSLGYQDEDWSRDILRQATIRPLPEPLKQEAFLALSRMEDNPYGVSDSRLPAVS
jgi:3-mercaptopropionate dioxygenase